MPFGSQQISIGEIQGNQIRGDFYGIWNKNGISPQTSVGPNDITILPGGSALFAVPTANGNGYWLVASDGGVFTFGDASSLYGPASVIRGLAGPIVGIAGTSDAGGYWEVASDGGIFSFGDAQSYGSEGGEHLNAPIVGMATLP